MVAIVYTFREEFFFPPHTHFDHFNGFTWEFCLNSDSKSKVHALPIDSHPLFENIPLPILFKDEFSREINAKASIIMRYNEPQLVGLLNSGQSHEPP